MAQIDVYLHRLASENKYVYPEDILNLYSSIANEDLRTLFAAYHAELNKCFTLLNNGIHYSYDDEGNRRLSMGGYFHAQDSRDLLSLIEAIDQLQSKCRATPYSFQLYDAYNDAIRRCRKFLAKSGGSSIPDDFSAIEIIDLEPIFQMTDSIALPQSDTLISSSLKMIGEGSYAKVFRYWDPNYNIPVVLKRAKSDLDDKELTRFKNEYEVLKGLHSPYVIEVYSYNDSKNEYTMESMDESIYDYIRTNNDKLLVPERKGIIYQVCRGLNYIHKKGLLHRDISLTNVFIKHYDDVNVIKIGDFGLVRIPESTLTSIQSEIKGSLNDPDLINVGFSNYEMCHETFALTRLCYFILTGRINIQKEKNEQIQQFWSKGTSTNREERYQSAEEISEAVKNMSI